MLLLPGLLLHRIATAQSCPFIRIAASKSRRGLRLQSDKADRITRQHCCVCLQWQPQTISVCLQIRTIKILTCAHVLATHAQHASSGLNNATCQCKQKISSHHKLSVRPSTHMSRLTLLGKRSMATVLGNLKRAGPASNG